MEDLIAPCGSPANRVRVGDVAGHNVDSQPLSCGRRAHERTNLVSSLVQCRDDVSAEEAGRAGDEGGH